MRKPLLTVPFLALALAAQGCEDDPPPAPPPPARPAPSAAADANRNAPAQNTARDGGPPPLSLPNGEQAFVESGTVRDPFRNYNNEIAQPLATVDLDERLVILPSYTLDDLRLVAVVLGTDSPYAMVKDPTGRGTILRRGMYVGRREVLQNRETGQQHMVHWRVARVLPARLRRTTDGQLDEQPAEVVFERADPSNRTAQLVERALALGAAGQNSQSVQTSTSALPSTVTIPGVGGAAPAYGPGGLAPPPPSAAPGAPPSTTTTVIVQQPPPSPAAAPREVPLSTAPPPVRVTGDESPLSNR